MIDFGLNDPRDMPMHLFFGVVRMDYRTAVRANVQAQNCSICPRYWYVDATFACERCGEEFTFSAGEQRVWYEEYKFWVDSIPKHCLACRRDARHVKVLRQEYDRRIAEVLERGDVESRKRLAAIIDRLCEFGDPLPLRVHDNRRRLAEHIARAESRS
jgi:hypothetical protein